MNFTKTLQAAAKLLSQEGWTISTGEDELTSDCDAQGVTIIEATPMIRHAFTLAAADGELYGTDLVEVGSADRFLIIPDTPWAGDQISAGSISECQLSVQDLVGLLREGERISRESHGA